MRKVVSLMMFIGLGAAGLVEADTGADDTDTVVVAVAVATEAGSVDACEEEEEVAPAAGGLASA